MEDSTEKKESIMKIQSNETTSCFSNGHFDLTSTFVKIIEI